LSKLLLAWSSGKDSAWALHQLRQSGVHPSALFTTLNQAADRVAMHAVRRQLLVAQAAEAAVPLWTVDLPWPCTNEDYEVRMREVCRRAVAEGFDRVAFGDLFLPDVRAYRERQLQGSGLTPVFPLWGLPTPQLARDMIREGLRARLTCLDPKLLARDFAGCEFDAAFLDGLPPGVDPCGENGEFHTFAYDGPMFTRPIPVAAGEVRESEGFVFADLRVIMS
jgi:uncharacterized protein (TIGR00290 family)